jgi:hypothetical protein
VALTREEVVMAAEKKALKKLNLAKEIVRSIKTKTDIKTGKPRLTGLHDCLTIEVSLCA